MKKEWKAKLEKFYSLSEEDQQFYREFIIELLTPTKMLNPFDTKPGNKVKFHGYGGYPVERNAAFEVLEKNKIYTVRRFDVGPLQTSYVHLEEIEGSFNSVMFENVD
jgi:hypothetical protein